MRLTDNFTLEEMCRSNTAARMGRKIDPSEDIIENLRYATTQDICRAPADRKSTRLNSSH